MSLLFDPIFHKIPPDTAFVDAYDNYLGLVYERLDGKHFLPRVLLTESAGTELQWNFFHALLEGWFLDFDHPLDRFRFLSAVATSARDHDTEIRDGRLTEIENDSILRWLYETGRLKAEDSHSTLREKEVIVKEAPQYFKQFYYALGAGQTLPEIKIPIQPLTKYPQEGKDSDDVKPILPQLIERLKKATQARGRKTELASWLGVSPQKVTDWLSGRVEPSGETALRLDNWVKRQERIK
jgi:hypothetical protein